MSDTFGSPMASLRTWLRSLPRRHGRTTLILLAAILAVGFGLRAYRVVEPLATPGDDARAYYALADALYEEGSYGGPDFRDASDWSLSLIHISEPTRPY